MNLSSLDMEELKWEEKEDGWRARVVNSQTNATSNSSMR